MRKEEIITEGYLDLLISEGDDAIHITQAKDNIVVAFEDIPKLLIAIIKLIPHTSINQLK